ncbi:RAS GUANINE NUCLEOTIDE EXCHANGE FACTOR K [Salix purpurea]|uniref:RAS GUANINE NUCLEOTIDE EXCHANGE FACTOR K n=1 Tax=Salix purpurea TaxID=77065 RepID=A0A9Q0Q0S4_SALPP|nr:RAS GUANINE NUCLEOTIDE EXCHANGE FACTOR K [Salix purpurea]
MINTFAASDDTLLDIHFSSRHVTFPDENIRSDQLQASVPLLLQPSDARSKSLLFDELRSFRASLKWCALDHSTCIGKFVSYFIFVFLAITLPMVSSLSIRVPSSAPADYPISYNKLVQLPESVLALIAFFTLFRFFKRYGLRQLLFLDDLQEDSLFIRRGYSRELDKAFRYLAWILFPSFIVEVAHKIIFFSTVKISLPCNVCPGNIPLNPIMFVLVLASWVYRTGVFLLVCVLFRLTCKLQILRFGGLHKLFDGCESDAGVIYREHVRIKKQLSFTSHRYRFFIISCLVTITVSQFGSLWLVLGFNNEKNFFNSGDLVICSAVQLSGAFLCLLGAARITHRAQGIVSIATRWQMSVASASTRIDQGKSHVPEADKTLASDAGENESDSSDIFLAISSQDSYSFQTRQALVAYLQHNNGGITLFGFALDRGLLHTLFAFEFSLVLWILSRVVVLS